MEKRLNDILFKNARDLIWILQHTDIYTAGTSFNEDDILDKSIKVKRTNRGGKITFHGPGQIIFYFVINLNKKKKDIRWFIKVIENTIIQTLYDFNIKSKGKFVIIDNLNDLEDSLTIETVKEDLNIKIRFLYY